MTEVKKYSNCEVQTLKEAKFDVITQTDANNTSKFIQTEYIGQSVEIQTEVVIDKMDASGKIRTYRDIDV